jgi:hypothetical protein
MKMAYDSDKRLLVVLVLSLIAAPVYAAVPARGVSAYVLACEGAARGWIRLVAPGGTCRESERSVSLGSNARG